MIMQIEMPEVWGNSKVNAGKSIAESIMDSIVEKPLRNIQARWNREREEKLEELWSKRGKTPIQGNNEYFERCF